MFEDELLKIKLLYEKGLYKQDFYSRKIVDKSVFDSYEGFQTIPFTFKSELRDTLAYERTGCENRGEVYGVFSSSGTTGAKTYYIYSKEDKKVHEEFVRTFYNEIGITSEDLGGVCAPVDTGVMAHTMMWQFTTMGAGYVNCPIPSPDNIVDLVTTLPVTVVATRPDIVSTVAYKSEWAEKAKKSKVKKMLLGGGFMSDQRRLLLEKTWDADVYNLFGMSEMFGPMAAECRYKDGQHYLNNYLMIELLDPVTLKPVKPGEIGIAIYTTLWWKGFPLLRYWTDDLMKIDYETCKCGSALPRLYHIGRMGDCIQLSDKIIFPKNVEEITIKYGYIWDYQVNEKKDSINLLIEKPEFMGTNRNLEEEMIKLFGKELTIEYKAIGALNYHGHGKRFIKE